jgi:hypothetical protein
MSLRAAIVIALAVSTPIPVAARVSFAAPAAYQTTIQVSKVAVADFDRDGNDDLLVAGAGVAVLLGNGDGTFRNTFSNGNADLFDAAAADVNGDGRLDIVAFGNPILTFLGKGDGTFQNPIASAAPSLPAIVIDLDGDKKADIVSADSQPAGHVLVYKERAMERSPPRCPTR